jgi:hypothetical protein
MFIPFQRLPIIDHFTCTTTRYIELFEQSVSFKLIVAQSFLIGYSRSPPNLMFTFYKHSLHTRYKCSFRIASRSSSYQSGVLWSFIISADFSREFPLFCSFRDSSTCWLSVYLPELNPKISHQPRSVYVWSLGIAAYCTFFVQHSILPRL